VAAVLIFLANYTLPTNVWFTLPFSLGLNPVRSGRREGVD